ncbi:MULTISPECIES: TetR/AcrR family transcriptional regulator [Pseudonocardia]|uniref:Bacterial regulatory protein n=2 Tax=Pseudonocardia TaxID=1847 RepID=A0A1Y2N1F4_PSEAH|nr:MULTISPECIES: TetR/AcrR family transcriptional regulator [Pseudonocardia]OSY41270.1 Bacterial regulatory protein [Pseudonocardia autotrophica]TDN76725.1 TetR family transcriptional regulator [Pseudonocardia autotrophica]BBG00727.1 TetR family transcriptional regulator [Pseudonocardia autotrophica]GEC24307.1 TetR family transcriptional regulator [Pseudonocardia saturnea]
MTGDLNHSPDPGPARRGRGRRPAEQVRREILDAAGEILLAEGMAAFTIERVAARSGASKVTLYKWWPSKGALALDGYTHAVTEQLAFPDTGDIEADLRDQLRSFVAVLRGPAGRAVAELVGQAQTDPELAAAFRAVYSGPRRALAVEALTRARQRGQIRADVDPEIVVDQLWGAGYHRLLIPDQPLTIDFTDALVRNLMSGIRVGAGEPA